MIRQDIASGFAVTEQAKRNRRDRHTERQWKCRIVGGGCVLLHGASINGPATLLRRFKRPAINIGHGQAYAMFPSPAEAWSAFWSIAQPHGITLAEYNRRATGRYK